MITEKIIIASAFSLFILSSCDSGGRQKITVNIPKDSSTQTIRDSNKIDDRFSIVGDFNGDTVQDTIFESYASAITRKETPKVLDNEDYEKNIEQIISNKPLSRLYSNLVDAD